ncbi:Plexin-A4 [Geodia barretti]|uniref:Plexin-A4 n=1 Tax=Geodia barretti TaxID=519541 RepID=A0AA35VXX3_GEOBA|nr:Plexin-A4 [Geodia barretti]
MDKSYTQCSNGENNALAIRLVWYTEQTCTTFSNLARGLCDFNLANHLNSEPALAAFDPVRGQHLLRFNNSEEITAVLTARVGMTTTTDLLYVALSTSQDDHFLDKYHITADGEVELVSRDQYSLPITLLRWNEIMQEIYGGNVNGVFVIPLERCSNYTTCGECTGSGDPLCGWCTLGQYCSQSVECSGSSHTAHWVDNQHLCIASVSLTRASMDVDLIQSVDLTIDPAEASLPSHPPHHYQCTLYHGSIDNATYSLTAPFTNGACQLQQAQVDAFDGSHIDLNFRLQLGTSTTEIFPTSSMLALHNCSLHTDCLKCVEASEVCGWCVHDRICTGNPTSCRHEEDWRTIDEDGVCPVVNTPDRGSYTLPVSVRRELILSTFNIPPEIPGYEYGCQIRYGNGSVLGLEAQYYNHTEFRCLTTEDQVHMSADVTNGSETTQLEILWLRSSDKFSVILHTIRLTLYDCELMGSDCSSCLSTNIGTGFDCLWCDKLDTADICTVLDHCKTHSTLFNDIIDCPLPTITGISPVSGPTVGGTRLTVTGTNIGAVAGDVTVELVKMMNQVTEERTPCLVDTNRYIPGSQIVCTTSEASEGDHLVSVTIRRGTGTARPLALPHTFTFAHPIINSVEPQQGPKAGGTYVLFQGSNLDISSPGAAKVFIGDVPCDIQEVTPTVISCVSRAVAAASSQHRTRVVIDNADMPSELYNYTENPVFTRVEPQNIIPAGGVTLTFRGRYLNIVLLPELIITVDNYTLFGTCTPRSSTILKCTAPKLPVVLLSSGTIERRAVPRSSLTGIINYTITMDGAEGPRSDQVDLQIVVKPNPVFYALHMNDRDYTLDSGRSIRILGSNIESVLPSELSVLVDDAVCTLAVFS